MLSPNETITATLETRWTILPSGTRIFFPPLLLSFFFRSGDSSRDVEGDLFGVFYTDRPGRPVMKLYLRGPTADAA